MDDLGRLNDNMPSRETGGIFAIFAAWFKNPIFLSSLRFRINASH